MDNSAVNQPTHERISQIEMALAILLIIIKRQKNGLNLLHNFAHYKMSRKSIEYFRLINCNLFTSAVSHFSAYA